MRQIEFREAQKQLSRLVAEAAMGDAFVIERDGKPLVKVLPLDTAERIVDTRPVKRIGFMDGLIDDISDDFDRLHEDEIAELFGVTDPKLP